jgi:hypothetical protein
MADLQRLEYHLQDVRFLAVIGSMDRYRAKRKLALGACNRFYNNSSGDKEREYILGIKRQIQEVQYVGERRR